MNNYEPSPIDTTKVVLPVEIESLLEQLAENSHDIWAQTRLKDGWTFGPSRNDSKKEHPCLIPYSELPESEKEYDRNTAMETLKVVYSLGYRLTKGDVQW